MWMLLPVLLVVGAVIGWYFYGFIGRVLSTLGSKEKRWSLGVRICVAALLALGSFWVTSMVAVVILHIMALGLLLDLVHLLVRTIWRGHPLRVWNKLYGLGVLPCLLTICILLAGYANMQHVVQTDYTVHTEKTLSRTYRVALVADVHFGVSLDAEALAKICGQISAQDVDLVVLGGDIVDESTSRAEMKEIFALLGGIKSRYGVFYVHGNHDRMGAWTDAELVEVIEGAGIHLLKDAVYQVNEELVIIGREDKSAERRGARKPIAELLAAVDHADLVLSVDHQPNDYAAQGAAGADLVLSGHTHGGQLFPLQFVQSIFGINDAVYGQVIIDQDTQAIVTSGIAGWRYPVKTAAPAEYVMIEID